MIVPNVATPPLKSQDGVPIVGGVSKHQKQRRGHPPAICCIL